MKNRIDTARLIRYRNCFKKNYRELYRWEDAKNDGKIVSLGYPVYNKILLRFVGDAYESGVMISNYREILAAYNVNDIDLLIERADITTVRAIFTYYIREETHRDGLWGRAVRKKCFLRILDRLEELN